MNDDKSLELINLYFDGELEKSNEANLFTLLASDQSKREYFRQLIVVRNSVENSMVEFPSELDERILRSVSSTSEKKFSFFTGQRLFASVSYAVALILLFLSGYLFFKVSSFQDRVDNLSQQMMIQSKTIQMLYNSLPGVEVIGTLDNKVIIKPNS
jgi:hypothetical protein